MGEQQVERQRDKNDARQTIHPEAEGRAAGEQRAQFSGAKGDGTENDDGVERKHAAQHGNLHANGTARGVGKLRQKGKEKQGDFGIDGVGNKTSAEVLPV